MDYRFQFSVVWQNWALLLQGAGYTLVLCVISGVLGFGLGLLCAELRRSGNRVASGAVAAYVEFIRNTPFLVQLFFVFFGLPSSGVRITAEQAAVIAMTVNIGAYFTEIIRAGLEGTGRGQFEAAKSLALPRLVTFFKVILPPALARVFPALGGQFVLVFLGSAVVSQISVPDLTYQAQFLQSRTFRAFELYFAITVMYVAMALGFRVLFRWTERRFFPWRQGR